jgi:hypothetical protein
VAWNFLARPKARGYLGVGSIMTKKKKGYVVQIVMEI